LRSVDAEAPQLTDERVRDGIIRRQYRDVLGRIAETRQSNRNIGLASAEGGDELWGLKKTLETRRSEAEHGFAEGDNKLGHEYSEYKELENSWKSRKREDAEAV
jgi:hypothetical protein